jgi:hypothetical protein
MKMKKLGIILAGLMSISAFAGCTNVDQKVMFEPYWNDNVSSGAVAIDETLTYNVTYDNENVSQLVNYTLDYSNGVYTTHLVGEESTDGFIYTYTTELNITVKFTLGNESKEFTDTMTSEVKFKSAGLQPISSKKEFKSHSPNDSQSMSLEDCYDFYHYTVETNYLDDCTNGTSVIKSLDPEKLGSNEYSFEIDQAKFTYLDNEQLLFALRGIRPTTTSAKVNVYSPFVNAIQRVAISFTAEETREMKFSRNGAEAKTETLTVRPASIVLDERNPGATQKVLVAKHSEAEGGNKNHNVLMHWETPLSYNLGTLKYDLQDMTYIKK